MTAPEWRDCADPDELAAAVAAGVVPLVRVDSGAVKPTKLRQASEFTMGIGWGDRYQLPTSWSPEPPAPDDGPLGIYVASRTIHAAMWKELRSEGVPIISTWLDEAGAGETEDFSDLWRRCVDEVKRAGRLVAFHSEGDVWKGAFIEIGVALGAGVPVTVVGGPPGSWLAHPLVSQARSVREAVGLASPGEPPEPPAPDDLAARARRHADGHPESRDLIEELLGAVEPAWQSLERCVDSLADVIRDHPDPGTEALGAVWEARRVLSGRATPTPPPTPPWPGAVLSGLVDEDGEPTWLAQAGQVRGEQVRGWREMAWYRPDGHSSDTWVEVRAPRAVPAAPVTVTIPAETAHALLRYIEDGDYDTDYVIDRLADLLIAAMDGDQ